MFTRYPRRIDNGITPLGAHFSDRSSAVDGNNIGVRWSPRYGAIHHDVSPVRKALNGSDRRKEKSPITLPKLTILGDKS